MPKVQKNIINNYLNNDLIPFSLNIGYNITTNKKEFIMNKNWLNVNKDNYKKFITNDIYKSNQSQNFVLIV